MYRQPDRHSEDRYLYLEIGKKMYLSLVWQTNRNNDIYYYR